MRSTHIDTSIGNTIIKLGGDGIKKCYQCGTCTAICPLSEENTIASRRLIKYIQLGLRERVESNLVPWLCYYCGECNDSCPKEAEPGEIMMATRRYLTTVYDWTGIAKKIYLSKPAKIIGSILLFLLAIFFVYLLHGPIYLDKVDIDSFAPLHVVEAGDIVILIVLSILLIGNIYRMYKYTVGKTHNKKLPITTYISEFIKTVPLHFLTQIRFRGCGSDRGRKNWIEHLLIVYGYATIFVFVVVFLDWFQTNTIYPIHHPIRLLGYVASAALLIGIGAAVYGRLTKNQPMRMHSHSTDWFFLTMLFLTVITGVLTNIFKYLSMPLETYATYAIHLGFVTPLLVLEVPFAKWSHLAYRPFALYFARLKELKEGI